MTRCKNGLWVLGVAVVATVLSAAPACFAANRDLIVMPKVAADSLPIAGDYWALIVGINAYKYVPALETAVRDATAVRDVLIERYGFKTEHVTVLLNEQASREGIEEALYRLGKQAGPNDSVFIYYAGHGQVDLESQRGFWVPVEGKAQSPSTFISNALIRDEIASMKARHVYFVADSCFSGTLFAKSRSLPPLNDKFFARLYANKSRWGLTSGQNEPVADQGKNGHSMFAYFFVKLLKENDEPYLVPSHIYDQIAPLVGRNAEQQPRSEPLQGAGDEGGQFVFRLASVNAGPVPSPRPFAPVISTPSPAPSAGLSQGEQELAALKEQERQMEELERKANQQRQIEEKKQQLAERKKRLEAKPEAEKQKLALSSFDGVWFCAQYSFGIRIEGKLGYATVSNSPLIRPGDRALQIESVSDDSFQGKHLFTDGTWQHVSGQLVDQRTLKIQGKGLVWHMSRE